jgi:spore maturation protein SpmB
MLIAHTFPIEIRIAQKAGVRARFSILYRFINAVILGGILSFIFSYFNMFQEESMIIWQPGISNPTLTQWIIGELRNYAMIFLIIFSLLILMRVLKNLGVIDKLNNALEPGLNFLGMSKNAAPLAIIGLTLGISYGGGLIIKEVKEKALSKKDAFLSLSMMGLTHSLIEDTLLMMAIGASLVGILLGRIIFMIIIMVLLIQIINKISNKTFNKFFSKNN